MNTDTNDHTDPIWPAARERIRRTIRALVEREVKTITSIDVKTIAVLRGKGKGEWRGIVDLVAIRKDTTQPASSKLKRGDLFEIILVQVKGGTARPPTRDDCIRLREVADQYAARAVVLFEWRRGVSWRFLVLNLKSLSWEERLGEDVFA